MKKKIYLGHDPSPYGLVCEGGEHDGKTVDGLKTILRIPNYKETKRIKDGRIVFEYVEPCNDSTT